MSLEEGRESSTSVLSLYCLALPGSQPIGGRVDPSTLLLLPFRIFKDARKDKGQDDFLGNVVLRLKVSPGCE